MIIPVRCFTCGKVVGSEWESFVERSKLGEDPAEIMDSLGVKRYCCRKMLLAHVDLINDVIAYG
jgi:DNA-directed RNA polymerase subunit N